MDRPPGTLHPALNTRCHEVNTLSRAGQRLRMHPMGEQCLQNLRWQILELGPEADQFDLAALEKIEYLVTAYGTTMKKGGGND